MASDKILIRPFDVDSPQDYGFAFVRFLQGVRVYNRWYEQIPEDIYRLNYEPIVRRLIERSKESRIACMEDDPDHLLGFAIIENEVLHWIHVKSIYRRLGISKKLLPVNLTAMTHLSNKAVALPSRLIFNPFLI